MARTRIKIEGIADLERKLSDLSDAARSDALVVVLKVGVMPLVNEAKENAPVLSGNLQRSIHSEVEPVGSNSAEARVGTNVEYALAQEFGTARMEGKRYMRDAADTTQSEVRDEVVAALRQLIRESVR